MPSDEFLRQFSDGGASGTIGKYDTRPDLGQADHVFVSTGPATEPVTTAEAKAFLRVRGASQDALVDSLIAAARQLAEQWTSRAFINQTIKLSLDRVPRQRFLELPRPVLASVTNIKSFDDAGGETTFDTANYIVSTERLMGRVTLAESATWPSDLRPADALVVTYQAGWADVAAVPAAIKAAIKKIIASIWEVREDRAFGMSSSVIPYTAKTLLSRYRIRKI